MLFFFFCNFYQLLPLEEDLGIGVWRQVDRIGVSNKSFK